MSTHLVFDDVDAVIVSSIKPVSEDNQKFQLSLIVTDEDGNEVNIDLLSRNKAVLDALSTQQNFRQEMLLRQCSFALDYMLNNHPEIAPIQCKGSLTIGQLVSELDEYKQPSVD